MKTKEIKEALKNQENGERKQAELQEQMKKCSDELTEILKKYDAKLISVQQDFYGQVVWVPTIVPNK